MLSGLANDSGPDGQLNTVELVTNSILLFIAGHETTVNLITNGMLTLLRNPHVLERLRAEPQLMPQAVEELLRFEPPVHLLGQRTPIVDIEIDGVTVPKGSPLVLALASANRDPERFVDADKFVPRPRGQPARGSGQRHPQLLRRSPSPASRGRWRSPNSSAASTIRASSRTRRPTGPTRCCEARGTCWWTVGELRRASSINSPG